MSASTIAVVGCFGALASAGTSSPYCCTDVQDAFVLNISYPFVADEWFHQPGMSWPEQCYGYRWNGWQASVFLETAAQLFELTCGGRTFQSFDLKKPNSGTETYFIVNYNNGTVTCKKERGQSARVQSLLGSGKQRGQSLLGRGKQQCIGKDLEKEHLAYVGQVLYGGTKFERFRTTGAGCENSCWVDVDMNNGACMPVRQGMTEFTNYRNEVPDSSYFEVPSVCQKDIIV